jgi:cytochrome c oxidase subunit 2
MYTSSTLLAFRLKLNKVFKTLVDVMTLFEVQYYMLKVPPKLSMEKHGMLTSPRLRAMLLSLLWVTSQPTQAEYVFNMTQGVTEISHAIHSLHMTIFWICVGIGVCVFSVMFYAIIWHRKSRGVVASHFHENTFVEIVWTIIPFSILIAMAIPATHLLIKMHDTKTDSALSIKITGHQWRWEYEYLGEGVRFISNLTTPKLETQNRAPKNPHYLREVDNPLVVPIGKKIRFLTTASDVIHSWWVPALGFKKDAIPGFINEAWAKIERPGIYRGQCAELCGVLHGFMPIVVEAKTEEEYQAWLAEKKAALKPPQENQHSTTQETVKQPTAQTGSGANHE